MMSHVSFHLVILSLLALVNSIKYVPGPAFPPLSLDADSEVARALQAKLGDVVRTVLLDQNYHTEWSPTTSSFAIQLTSADETIWTSYHTADVTGNVGAVQQQVSGGTVFRIASITKTFTVLALLLDKSIFLDDSIIEYIPELSSSSESSIQWNQITLRALASHLAGIPRDTGGNCFVWNEILDREEILPILEELGFPPINASISHELHVCRIEDIIGTARNAAPVFNPNERSTYSNIAFSLLGAVLERETGVDYEEIIKSAVLDPLEMYGTTTRKPSESQGIIPAEPNDWMTDLGADAPTAGLYSTADDCSKYMRSILGAQLLSQAETNQWLKPVSWTNSGNQAAYGMPWEILRTTLTPDGRTVDIFAKAGSLRGYYSSIIMLPEFRLGLTILVAGAEACLDELREGLVTSLVPAIDAAGRDYTRSRYAGTYWAEEGRWSIKLDVDKGQGLKIIAWVSNGTDFLASYRLLQGISKDCDLRLMPTGVLLNEADSWRISWDRTSNRLWNDFTFTNVDDIVFDNMPLGEMFISTEGDTIEALGITYIRT